MVGALSAIPAPALARSLKANDTIRLGIIGVRGKGAHHIEIFQKLSGAKIVALCDADSEVLQREQDKLAKNQIKTDGYRDMRRLLDRKDIDAVVTATPNHWHSLVTVWACQAGKDVYVEKPVSHNVWEGRKAVEAARKYKRIVQTGTQSRTDPALHEAFHYLRAGNLGTIRLARGFCYKRRESIGRVAGPQSVPASVDYNLWSGPAPMVPLMRKNLHYDWHWVWPTGNGDIGNQGVHEIDMCRWAIGQQGLPERILSLGGRFGYVDDAETPNTQLTYYDYQPVPILFEVRGLPQAAGDEGEAMDSYKGVRIGVVIECENGYFAGGAGGGWAFDKEGRKLKQFVGTGGKDHQENFLKAVRSRKVSDLSADILEGHRSSALCHLGNISVQLGQRLSREKIQSTLRSNQPMEEAFGRFQSHLQANGVDLSLNHVALGPSLSFDPTEEKFRGEWSEYSNLLLRRDYREPFAIRDHV
jgi:predicted dehydrogenase